MSADRIEFGGRQARVRHQRPRVELRGGEQQHDLHDAVLGHDHYAIAATHAPFAQLRGGGIDGFQKLRAGQAARIFDQGDVLRIARGRERRNLGNTRGQGG